MRKQAEAGGVHVEPAGSPFSHAAKAAETSVEQSSAMPAGRVTAVRVPRTASASSTVAACRVGARRGRTAARWILGTRDRLRGFTVVDASVMTADGPVVVVVGDATVVLVVVVWGVVEVVDVVEVVVVDVVGMEATGDFSARAPLVPLAAAAAGVAPATVAMPSPTRAVVRAVRRPRSRFVMDPARTVNHRQSGCRA
jgi:hypothetical protein